MVGNATEVFGSAAYYNEDYGFEANWQESYWGDNYARLLKIKNVLDPHRVFNGNTYVGSEGGY